MTTAAALAGATAANVGAIAIAKADSDDSELLALGIELEGLIKDYFQKRAIERYYDAQWEANCERAGLPRLDFETVTRKEYEERHKQRQFAANARADCARRGRL